MYFGITALRHEGVKVIRYEGMKEDRRIEKN